MAEMASSPAQTISGTMFCDDVSVDAGGEGADYLDPGEMQRIAEDLGRVLRQRTTTYGWCEAPAPAYPPRREIVPGVGTIDQPLLNVALTPVLSPYPGPIPG